MNLPWSFSSTTSRELLSQFSNYSGWKWPEVGDKWKKQFHEHFRSKTTRFPEIKSVSKNVKWCFSASWGLKRLNIVHRAKRGNLGYVFDLVGRSVRLIKCCEWSGLLLRITEWMQHYYHEWLYVSCFERLRRLFPGPKGMKWDGKCRFLLPLTGKTLDLPFALNVGYRQC